MNEADALDEILRQFNASTPSPQGVQHAEDAAELGTVCGSRRR